MTFAEKVKYVRATLQLSQKQLAEKLNVTYVSVSRCKENGIDFEKLED